ELRARRGPLAQHRLVIDPRRAAKVGLPKESLQNAAVVWSRRILPGQQVREPMWEVAREPLQYALAMLRGNVRQTDTNHVGNESAGREAGRGGWVDDVNFQPMVLGSAVDSGVDVAVTKPVADHQQAPTALIENLLEQLETPV